MKYQLKILVLLLFLIEVAIAQSEDINIGPTGQLQTHANSQMGIFGNLENNGAFTELGGEVGFYNQQTTQTVSGSNAPQIFDLIINNPNDVNLEVSTIANLSVNFTNGRVITPRDNPNIALDFNETDLYLGENNDRHVDGYTSYTGAEAYSFPIGDEFRLRPVSIEAGAATSTAKAAYFFEDPSFPSTFSGFDRNETDENLANISEVEFWDLDGNSSTTATLTWDAISSINDLINDGNLSELRVVGWSEAEAIWVDLGNSSATGDTNQGSITSVPFIPNEYTVITFGGPRAVVEIPNDVTIYNAVSADGNNDNPYFRIGGIETFANNNLKIFNRWGVLVFEQDNYTEPNPMNGDAIDSQKVFTGLSNGRATIQASKKLPTGTYFYILNYSTDAGQSKQKAGYLYLQN